MGLELSLNSSTLSRIKAHYLRKRALERLRTRDQLKSTTIVRRCQLMTLPKMSMDRSLSMDSLINRDSSTTHSTLVG